MNALKANPAVAKRRSRPESIEGPRRGTAYYNDRDRQEWQRASCGGYSMILSGGTFLGLCRRFRFPRNAGKNLFRRSRAADVCFPQ